jgi:hypothetical protein
MMQSVIRILKFFGIFLVLAVLVRGRILGLYLTPKIEASLTHLFGMPIEVTGLWADPITGRINIKRFDFKNPDGFTARPHIRLENLKADANLRQLFNKKVSIPVIQLTALHYLIERRIVNGGPVSNAQIMVRSVKTFRRLKREREALNPPAPGKDWEVEIGDVRFADGSFIFESFIDTTEVNRYVFQRLKGNLNHLYYPWERTDLHQYLRLEGRFGELFPEPFWVEGKANFMTSDISFDLQGKVSDGPVDEYRKLWKGLPMHVDQGVFELSVHAVCKLDKLKADTVLQLRSLQIQPPVNIAERLWGMPLLAVINFIEDEKQMTLKIPMHGDISDPKFDMPLAFRTAFQESFQAHTTSGLAFIREAPAKIAAGTQEMAARATQTLTGGVGQVTNQVVHLVKAPGAAVNQALASAVEKSQTNQ